MREHEGQVLPATIGERACNACDGACDHYTLWPYTWWHLPLAEAVEGLLVQVVHVGAVRAARPVDLGVEHPAKVRPVEALVARVRVERRLGVQVVVAVVGDPLERPALCVPVVEY